MSDYIHDLRKKTGHMPLILNAVAGVVLNDDNQVLLQKRTDSNNWSLPGGYMEYGETFEQTLKREMLEDSGLKVEPIRCLTTLDQGFTTYPNGDKCQCIGRFYLVRVVGGSTADADKSEAIGLKYFDLNDLPEIFNQQTIDILKYVQKHVIENNER